MATTKKTTSTSFMTEIQDMVTGFTNSVPSSLRSMNVGGVSMSIAQVLTQLQAILQMLVNVTASKAQYQAAVAAKKAGLVAARGFYENIVVNLKQAFGSNQTLLGSFGVPPPKVKNKPTSTTRAIAHAKSLATRAARGTKGTKQKAAITATAQPTVQVLGPDGQPIQPGGTPPEGSSAPAAPAPVAPATPAAPAAPAAPTPAPGH